MQLASVYCLRIQAAMRFLLTVKSTLVSRRVFAMSHRYAVIRGPNAACFIATQANRPRSLMIEPYRLPNLLALLPKKPGGEINPHLKETETAFNTWVEAKIGKRCAMEIYQSDCPLLVAMAYPLASSQQLRQILDYCAAGFLFDDLLERSSSENAQALSQVWMSILRDGNRGKTVQHSLIEMMLSDLLLGIEAFIGPLLWPRFIADFEKVAMHMVQEVHNREAYLNNTTTLDIQSYITMRRWTVGACVGFVSIRATRYLYIPDDVLANPVIQEMENAITDMVHISNDIHSFKKEYSFDSAFNNLLTVIQKDPETAHLDFQERLDYAEKLFKAAVDRFHACRRELPSFNPEIDQYLNLYGDGLIDLAAGNLQWSRVCRRYRTFMNDEDRRDNIMRLALE